MTAPWSIRRIVYKVNVPSRSKFISNTGLKFDVIFKMQGQENQNALQKAIERREYYDNLLQTGYQSKENQLNDKINTETISVAQESRRTVDLQLLEQQ